MVESRFIAAPTPEVLALLPDEQARGRELDAAGVRRHLFVAADNSASWQVYELASREEVNRVVESFPFHPYMTETITDLADVA
jgi:muconolactone delta-isomerase